MPSDKISFSSYYMAESFLAGNELVRNFEKLDFLYALYLSNFHSESQ